MSMIPAKRRFYGAAALILIICSVVYLLCFQTIYYVFKEGYDRSLRKPNQSKDNELLNLTNFRYTIQPTDAICNSGSEELDAIIVITSAAGDYKLRSHHRAGISNENLRKIKMVRVFLLGSDLSHSSFVTQKAIQTEHKQFNDIVQGNFLDSYHNLTYKNVMGLRWASSHPCLESKYIFKVDDDIVVDYFHLTHYLLTNHYDLLKNNKSEYFLAGLVYNGTVPVRDSSKWRVSCVDYAASHYPAYLSGWCVVTTPYTARSLLSAYDRSAPIFWIDDLWIFGILREMADIPLVNMLNKFYTYQVDLLECCMIDLNKYRYRCPLFVGPNVGNEKLVEQFLKATHKQCYNMTSDIMNDHCIERDYKSFEKSCCLRFNYDFCKRLH